MEELSGHRFDDLLDLMAGARAAPAAGSAAGWCLGIAAALLGKTARLSHRQLSDWHDHAATADELRSAALALAEDDAQAVIAMIQAAKRVDAGTPVTGAPASDAPQSPGQTSQHADAPEQIRALARRVCDVASLLARDGNPWLYADAEAARLLGEASFQIAETLIRVNDTQM